MITCTGDRCALQGPVNMANVESLLEEGSRQIAGAQVTVDLAGVTEVDSSALSLLLEWQRQALRAGRSVRYLNVPANLRSLAALYGVTELLGDASVTG